MKKRTFLEYATDYCHDKQFNTYARLFINWSEVNGCIRMDYTNNIYAYSREKFYASNNWKLNESPEKLLEEFTQLIHKMGYRNEFFIDNKAYLKTELKNIEKEFCENFLSNFLSNIRTNYKGLEESTIEEILTNFKAYGGKNLLRNKAEANFFWKNFEDFLRYMPYGDEEVVVEKYGYALVRNLNDDWSDIGVVIYNKADLSHEILFYQIGDNN